jgi:hypothetical protein
MLMTKTTTKEDFVLKLNSPIMANLIIERIESVFGQNIPNKGILCGQSVASAIFEILNLNITPVYNDIDIFSILINSMNKTENYFRNLELRQNNKDASLSSYGIFNAEINHYGQVEINKLSSYKILESISYGKINKTYVLTYKNLKYFKLSDLTMEIIENFDINSTQVGISLIDKKLVFTENFLNFLISKQLEIVKWNTPIHSFIRIIKKQKELGNVFFNKEETILLLGAYSRTISNISQEYKKLKEIDIDEKHFLLELSISRALELPIFFGEKHLKDLETYIPEDIKSLFELKYKGNHIETESDFLITSAKKSSKEVQTIIFKDNKYIEDFLYEIRKSNIIYSSFKNEYLSYMDSLFYEVKMDTKKYSSKIFENSIMDLKTIIELIPYSFKSIKNTSKKKFIFLDKFLFKTTFNGYSHNNNYIVNDLADNFKLNMLSGIEKLTPNFLDKGNLMNKLFVKEHSIIEKIKLLYPIEKWPLIAENLRKIEKEEDFGSAIFGLFENKNFEPPLYIIEDINKLKTIFKKYLKDINKDLKKDSIINIESKDFILKELIKPIELLLEGEEMKHCVGGYSEQVRAKNSLIFKCRTKSCKFTIEINTIKNKENNIRYTLNQVRGKQNKKLSFKECKRHLDILNKEFNIYPISNFVYESSFLYSPDEKNNLIKMNILTKRKKLKNESINEYEQQNNYPNILDNYLNNSNLEEIPF